jgi:hypothetical protein
VTNTIHGGGALLHGLEESSLGLRRGPVDLVRQEQVGEERTGPEAYGPTARLEDRRPDHVAGHEIGRELHAPEANPESRGERLDEQRLRHPGHTLHERVRGTQQRHEELAEHRLLPHHDGAHGLAQRGEPGGHGGDVDRRLGHRDPSSTMASKRWT